MEKSKGRSEISPGGLLTLTDRWGQRTDVRCIYCGPSAAIRHYGQLLRLLMSPDESALHKKLTRKALLGHIPYIPHLLRRWSAARKLDRPNWIVVKGLYQFGPSQEAA